MCGFENFSRRLTNENESLRGWPNMICAGERLQFGSQHFPRDVGVVEAIQDNVTDDVVIVVD